MQITLIASTRGRTSELARLFASLAAQSYPDFSVYVTDQNADDRLKPIIDRFKHGFPILRLRSAQGLSRGRNAGLEQALGDIVAFPDDDCWYPRELLEKVVGLFRDHPDLDGLSVRSFNEKNQPTVPSASGRHPVDYDLLSVLRRDLGGISYCIFLRRRFVEAVGRFDESLGVGAGTRWGACEESDYLIRGLKLGKRIAHFPELHVFHPDKDYGPGVARRTFDYACGYGRLLRKHRYPLWYVTWNLTRPLITLVLGLPQGRVRLVRRWNFILGVVSGYADETPFPVELDHTHAGQLPESATQ